MASSTPITARNGSIKADAKRACYQMNETSSSRRAAYFGKDISSMTYPLVADLAADGIPVAVTWRVLAFSKQAQYAWRSRGWD